MYRRTHTSKQKQQQEIDQAGRSIEDQRVNLLVGISGNYCCKCCDSYTKLLLPSIFCAGSSGSGGSCCLVTNFKSLPIETRDIGMAIDTCRSDLEPDEISCSHGLHCSSSSRLKCQPNRAKLKRLARGASYLAVNCLVIVAISLVALGVSLTTVAGQSTELGQRERNRETTLGQTSTVSSSPVIKIFQLWPSDNKYEAAHQTRSAKNFIIIPTTEPTTTARARSRNQPDMQFEQIFLAHGPSQNIIKDRLDGGPKAADEIDDIHLSVIRSYPKLIADNKNNSSREHEFRPSPKLTLVSANTNDNDNYSINNKAHDSNSKIGPEFDPAPYINDNDHDKDGARKWIDSRPNLLLDAVGSRRGSLLEGIGENSLPFVSDTGSITSQRLSDGDLEASVDGSGPKVVGVRSKVDAVAIMMNDDHFVSTTESNGKYGIRLGVQTDVDTLDQASEIGRVGELSLSESLLRPKSLFAGGDFTSTVRNIEQQQEAMLSTTMTTVATTTRATTTTIMIEQADPAVLATDGRGNQSLSSTSRLIGASIVVSEAAPCFASLDRSCSPVSLLAHGDRVAPSANQVPLTATLAKSDPMLPLLRAPVDQTTTALVGQEEPKKKERLEIVVPEAETRKKNARASKHDRAWRRFDNSTLAPMSLHSARANKPAASEPEHEPRHNHGKEQRDQDQNQHEDEDDPHSDPDYDRTSQKAIRLASFSNDSSVAVDNKASYYYIQGESSRRLDEPEVSSNHALFQVRARRDLAGKLGAQVKIKPASASTSLKSAKLQSQSRVASLKSQVPTQSLISAPTILLQPESLEWMQSVDQPAQMGSLLSRGRRGGFRKYRPLSTTTRPPKRIVTNDGFGETDDGADKHQLKTIYFAGFFPHLGDDINGLRMRDSLVNMVGDQFAAGEDDAWRSRKHEPRRDYGSDTFVRRHSAVSEPASARGTISEPEAQKLSSPTTNVHNNKWARAERGQLAQQDDTTPARAETSSPNAEAEAAVVDGEEQQIDESSHASHYRRQQSYPFNQNKQVTNRQHQQELAIANGRLREAEAAENEQQQMHPGVTGQAAANMVPPTLDAAQSADEASLANNNNNFDQRNSTFLDGSADGVGLGQSLYSQFNGSPMFAANRPFGKSVAPSPFNNYDQLGKLVLPAVRLALEHINKNGSLLRNYRLEIVPRDTQCNATVSLKKFFDLVYEEPKKMLLYGDACRVSTDPIAKASYFFDLIQISYADTDPIYTTENYPNFFRVIPSENALSSARIPFIRHFNWTRVGTIYQNLPRYSLPHSKLLTDLERFNIVIKQSVSLPGGIDGLQNQDLGDELRKLKERDVRIILGNFDEQWALLLFCEAYRERMTGRKYQWILTGISEDRLWRYYKQHGSACSEAELLIAMDGYIITDITPVTRSQERTISGLRAQEFSEEYRRRAQQSFLGQSIVGNLEENKFYGYVYDGIWAIALALDLVDRHLAEMHRRHKSGSVRLNPEVEPLRSLDDFDYSKPIWARLIRAALSRTNFAGVTAHQGSRSEVVIASYDALVDKLDFEVGFPIFWRGSSPPIDYTIQKVTPFRINRSLFIVISILAIFGIILAIIFLTINIKFRNQRYIKMSSPYLNNLIIIGCILTYLSVIILGLDSGLTSESNFPFICNARAWVLMAGFTLAFGSMFSKTFRVHSIFTNIKLHKKVIKDYKLFMVVFILLTCDISILIVWQYFDPFYRETNNGTSIQDMEKEDVIIVPEMEHCQSHRMTIFLGIIYVYKGLLMAFGCFLAWETRHVSIPALNDSKYIGLSVYNVVIMCVIGVGLSFALRDQQDASFVINSIFIIFCSTTTLCLVFVPKVRMLIELRQNPKAADQRVRATLKTFAKNYRDGNLGAAGATLGTGCRDHHGNLIHGSRNQIDLNEKIKLLSDDNTKQRTSLKDKTFELEALTYKYKKICTMIQSGQYLQALNTTTAHQQHQLQQQSLISTGLKPTIEPATIVSPQVSFGVSGTSSRNDSPKSSTIVKLPFSASANQFRSPVIASRPSLSPISFDTININPNNNSDNNENKENNKKENKNTTVDDTTDIFDDCNHGKLINNFNLNSRRLNNLVLGNELTVDPSTSCSTTTKMTASFATTATGTNTFDYSSMGLVLAEMSTSTGSLSYEKKSPHLSVNKQQFETPNDATNNNQTHIVQQFQVHYGNQSNSCKRSGKHHNGKHHNPRPAHMMGRKTSSVRSMEFGRHQLSHSNQSGSIDNHRALSRTPGSNTIFSGIPRALSMIEFLGSLYFTKDTSNKLRFESENELDDQLGLGNDAMRKTNVNDELMANSCCCHCDLCFGSQPEISEDCEDREGDAEGNQRFDININGEFKHHRRGMCNQANDYNSNNPNSTDVNNYSSMFSCEFSGATSATTSNSNSAGELVVAGPTARQAGLKLADDNVALVDCGAEEELDYSFDSQLSCSLCCSAAFCSQSQASGEPREELDDDEYDLDYDNSCVDNDNAVHGGDDDAEVELVGCDVVEELDCDRRDNDELTNGRRVNQDCLAQAKLASSANAFGQVSTASQGAGSMTGIGLQSSTDKRSHKEQTKQSTSKSMSTKIGKTLKINEQQSDLNSIGQKRDKRKRQPQNSAAGMPAPDVGHWQTAGQVGCRSHRSRIGKKTTTPTTSNYSSPQNSTNSSGSSISDNSNTISSRSPTNSSSLGTSQSHAAIDCADANVDLSDLTIDGGHCESEAKRCYLQATKSTSSAIQQHQENSSASISNHPGLIARANDPMSLDRAQLSSASCDPIIKHKTNDNADRTDDDLTVDDDEEQVSTISIKCDIVETL